MFKIQIGIDKDKIKESNTNHSPSRKFRIVIPTIDLVNNAINENIDINKKSIDITKYFLLTFKYYIKNFFNFRNNK